MNASMSFFDTSCVRDPVLLVNALCVEMHVFTLQEEVCGNVERKVCTLGLEVLHWRANQL